eukprot:PITA_11831
MTDLGLLHYCLGVEVWQTENHIFLSQSKYAKNLVDRFIMQDCKPAMTPMEPGLKLSAQSSSLPVDETLFSSDPILSGYTDSDWAEAEYRGAVKASCEAVWLRRMLADMHASQTSPTSLFCDNQGVLKLAKNPVFHERTKHVETHCHYIRQLVEDGSVQLRYVPTTEQPADIFTKPLGPDKFVKFRGSIGVANRLSIKGGY